MRRLPSLLMLALASIMAGSTLGACAKLGNNLPTPTPIPTPSFGNRQVVTVTRGTIDEQVKALGRVDAAQQATMYFRQDGRLYHLYVDMNQQVKKGTLLAQMDETDLKQQIKAAQVNVEIAQLQVDKAMGKDVPGTNSSDVANAKAAVAKAEANYASAESALDALLTGPSKSDLDAAQTKVVSAQQKLQQDQAALTLLQTPLSPDQITVLKANLDTAQAALNQAQAAYDRVKNKPDVGATQQSADLQKATADYKSAKAAFDQATAGPNPDDVSLAKQKVASDQKALDAATANLKQLQQGASANDVDAARNTVASAKSALDAARAGLTQALGAQSGTSVAVQIAEKQADIAKLNLAALQQQLDAAQLRAPFDGIITETDAQDGDQLKAYTPVLTIANPSKLDLSVELQPDDLAQVALGMPASIVFSAYPTAKLEGKIIQMPSITTGNTANLPANLRTVSVSFPKPPGAVSLGDLANVTIDVQRKEGVLILPTTAIITAGGKSYVHILRKDGTTQEVYVELGIQDDTNTEIMKGLQAGMKVLIPTTIPPTPIPSGGGAG